jgi:regulator of replication initiation timing
MLPKDYFVGIYDPLDVRRNILESSKEIIKSLQIFEKLKNIRQQKLGLFKQMRTVMQEFDTLISKLQRKLPKTHLRKTLDSSKPFSKKTHTNTQFSSVLAKLDEQLRKVERDLSSLK